jgi:DNA-binding MurR/RpiR family transcriptional regulator
MINYFLQNKKLFGSFSEELKKVSSYLSEKPEAFIINNSEQIGRLLGVNESAVFLFVKALGYPSYYSLQQNIQDTYLNQRSSFHNYQASAEKLENKAMIYNEVMKNDMVNIEKTMAAIDPVMFQEAVTRIAKADHVLVSGIRSSFSMAQWFSFMLNLLTGKTSLYRSEIDDVLWQLSKMNENAICFVFSFHRYSTEPLKLMEEVKERGAYILAVTDSKDAPACHYADASFIIEMEEPSTIMLAPVVFSLLNSILTALTIENPEQIEARKRQYDQLHSHSFFVPKDLYSDKVISD